MVRGEELVVGSKGWRLGQLGRQGVNPLTHQAGHGVVNLAEVEGDHLTGQLPQLLGRLHHLLAFALALLPHSLASSKAAVLNQLEYESGLATAWRPSQHHPPTGGQVAGQVRHHVLVQPLTTDQHWLFITLRHLKEEWFEEPLDRAILGGKERLGPSQTLGVSAACQSSRPSGGCGP